MLRRALIVRVAHLRMWRRPLKVVLVSMLLIAVQQSDWVWLRWPQKACAHFAKRIRRSLQRQGVVLLFTADQLPGVDWVSGHPVKLCGTACARGRFGTALHFDGGRRSFVELPCHWDDLGSTFTLALWLNLASDSPDQDLMYTRMPRPMGLKLDRGNLSFFSGTGEIFEAVSYPFTNYDRYVQVAVVADFAARTIRLFENGEPKEVWTNRTLVAAGREIALGTRDSRTISDPIKGKVDEVVIWNRNLSEHELRRLAAGPALSVLTPGAWFGYRGADCFRLGGRRMLKLFDNFNPLLYAPTAGHGCWPEISIVLSKADEKFFAKAHHKSLKSGRLLEDLAGPRTVDLLVDGRVLRSTLRLATGGQVYPSSPRRSYILEPPEGETVVGLSRVLLRPPESAGWLESLLETRVARDLGVGMVSNGLCRLMINGRPAGIYVYEDYHQLGVRPGKNPEFFDGLVTDRTWPHLEVSGPVPLTSDRLRQLLDEVSSTYRLTMERDFLSPYSSREINRIIRKDKWRLLGWPMDEMRAQADPVTRAAALLSPFSVLGSNPAPFYVFRDLALPEQLGEGVRAAWISSEPSLISHRGVVTCPPGDRPVGVTLGVHLAQGAATYSTQFLFRVMPERGKLPALFLWADSTLDRLRREDAAVDYYPADRAEPAVHWLAARERRAGLSFRGNACLVSSSKRAYGLRLAAPHGWWGTTNVCKINLVNPCRDPTLVHNALSYGLFGEFGGPGRRRDHLPVTWVEVFANGTYRGIYEATPSVRAEWLNLPPNEEEDEWPALVLKGQRKVASLHAPNMMRQTEPSRRHGCHPEAYLELEKLIEDAPDEEFVRDIARLVDLDNLVDFHLLMEFCKNGNGWPFMFAIHDILVRPAGEAGQFFLVPQDLDSTYDPESRCRFYVTHVFRRLQKLYPGYNERLAARWLELRAGPLRQDHLRQTILGYQEHLSGYVEWDDQRWGRNLNRTHAERINALLASIDARLAELDQRYQSASP